jgi:hypothetical protein
MEVLVQEILHQLVHHKETMVVQERQEIYLVVEVVQVKLVILMVKGMEETVLQLQ